MNNPLKFTLYLKVIERVLSIKCIPMSVGGSVTTLTMSGFLFDERLVISTILFHLISHFSTGYKVMGGVVQQESTYS